MDNKAANVNKSSQDKQPTSTFSRPQPVDVSRLRIFRQPAWKLRLTIDGDRSYPLVKVVRAAPLSHPDQYISLLDSQDEEICMIDDLKQLDEATRDIINEELDRRYLTSTVQRINSMRNEFGTSYWEVETDRGRREFVVQNVAENARWLGDNRLLLTDVDGNRFEIPRLDLLDKKSSGFVEQVL
jgi:hypothetical protein|tara:strand:- start:1023 stop:1574 length:552 start_codon:yes stop_codon:yes gene_type:complete